MKASCPTDVPLVSRMVQVSIKLLLIRGQREENGLKKSIRENDTGRECMSYGMKWECLM